MEGGGGGGDGGRVQNVVIMRHGDRIDHLTPEWVDDADRPWDPPLHDGGKARAWSVGKKLRRMEFPIHRVLVSPFLRCRQTAAEVVSAICAVDANAIETMEGRDCPAIDPSKVKVSIEYGLCEIIGTAAIPLQVAPKGERWFDGISILESLFLSGTIDHAAKHIYEAIPDWGEEIEEARRRYDRVSRALADMYPQENLLLVTHGECVATSVNDFFQEAKVREVDYCGFSHFKRQVPREQSFVLCNQNGVSYFTSF